MPAYEDKGFSPPAPVARVILRHPDRGESLEDVPMLIDSGADATLLPRSAVASLGIEGTGDRFRLKAYDGTISEAEAVRVDLIFLNKRFRGGYLVLDAEIGIIGRDVLNHVRLQLDGPALTWRESGKDMDRLCK